jgi:hypothetical protein
MSELPEHVRKSVIPLGQAAVHVLQIVSSVPLHPPCRNLPLGHVEQVVHTLLLLVVQAVEMYCPAGHEVEQAVQTNVAPAEHGALTYCPLGHVVPHARQALLPAGAYVPPGHVVQTAPRETRGAHRKPMMLPR